MKYRQLGTSDIKISEISFGCMSLGKNKGEDDTLINKAMEGGINFFDTADLYDKSANEEAVGAALKPHRHKVILASKVGNQWRPDGSGWDWNPTKKYILGAIEKSLQRLQTDYIDLYQLHGGTIDDPIDETIEAFEQLKQEGKIRHYGISSIRPNVIREYVNRSHITSVMMQYSLLDRRPEESCLSLLKENNISVLARGTIAQGLLIDKPATSYLNYTANQVANAAQAVRSISNGTNAVVTSIQFVLQHPAVTSCVVGVRTKDQLRDILQAASAPPLSSAAYHTLQQAIPGNHYEQHR